MDSGGVDKVIHVLKNAKSDNEIFAALLLVTKVIKGEECDAKTRHKIFDAVGFNFLNRLLKTEAPEGCPATSFKSLALSLLSSFITDSELVTHPQMLSKITTFCDVVGINPDQSESQSDVRSMVDDSYQCLCAISALENGRKTLLEQHAVQNLCEAISEQFYSHERALQILVALLHHHGHQIWQTYPEDLANMLQKLSSKFRTEQDAKKFELCETLSVILFSATRGQIEPSAWSINVHHGITDILKSKIGPAQREPAFRLACIMVQLLGIPWACGQETETPKFLLLLVHLTCIEIRVTLEDKSFDEIMSSASTLSSCYGLLEHIIDYMTTGPSMNLDEKQVSQLHAALVGAFNSIMYFLGTVSAEHQDQKCAPVVSASIRVLGLWLAEETSAMREEVYALLPFLIDLSRESFHVIKQEKASDINASNASAPNSSASNASASDINASNASATDSNASNTSATDSNASNTSAPDSNASNASASDNTEPNESESVNIAPASIASENMETNQDSQNTKQTERNKNILTSGILFNCDDAEDVLKFLLPSFCHLTAEDEPRALIIEHDGHVLLGEYFSYHWSLFAESKNRESEVALITMCGIFMNIAVLEPKLVSEHQVFKELLCFAVSTVPGLVAANTHLVLVANFTVLGEMLLRHQAGTTDIPQTDVRAFFSSIITFLRHAHKHKIKDGCNKVYIAKEYREVWDQIAELWFLGIQVFTAAVKLYPWLSGCVIKSGWVKGILGLLMKGEGHGIEEETFIAYGSLLLELCRHSQEAKDLIRNHQGLEIARHHGMVDLATVLQT